MQLEAVFQFIMLICHQVQNLLQRLYFSIILQCHVMDALFTAAPMST